MAFKKETGGVKLNENSSTSFKGGRIERTISKLRVDKNGELHRYTSSFGVNLVPLLIGILLCAGLFSLLRGSYPKTFYSFLTMLQSVDTVPIDWLIEGFKSVPVGDIPFLGGLLEPLWNILYFIWFLVIGLVNALKFVLSIVYWIII